MDPLQASSAFKVPLLESTLLSGESYLSYLSENSSLDGYGYVSSSDLHLSAVLIFAQLDSHLSSCEGFVSFIEAFLDFRERTWIRLHLGGVLFWGEGVRPF